MKGPRQRSFEELMQVVAAGSQDASWEIIDRYSANILRAVKQRLPAQLSSKVDATDIVQSVWKSLLRRDDVLPHVESPQEFVAYVVRMATYKVLEANRHWHRERCSIKREQPLAPDSEGDRLARGLGANASPRHGSDDPVDIADVRSRWQRSITACGGDISEIINLRLQSVPDEEIASRLGISPSTVRRRVQKLLELFVA